MNKIKTITLSALLLASTGLLSTVFLNTVSASANSYDAMVIPVQSIAVGTDYTADCNVNPGEDLDTENCGIIAYTVLGINILSAVAGMAIVASIIIAGFQYMTAQDNSGQIEVSRKRIIWAMTALLVFVFMYAFLNFIVPGGVL